MCMFRFCRQETSCEQDDFYPKHCHIRVNNQYCPLQVSDRISMHLSVSACECVYVCVSTCVYAQMVTWCVHVEPCPYKATQVCLLRLL